MLRVIHERCAGLDVHKKTVVACVMVDKSDGQVPKEGPVPKEAKD